MVNEVKSSFKIGLSTPRISCYSSDLVEEFIRASCLLNTFGLDPLFQYFKMKSIIGGVPEKYRFAVETCTGCGLTENP